MAARAIWKGYLKLSLVSCAVALYPAATSTSKVRFNTLNRRTGNRVKRLYVDAETGEPVETEDQVKGFKVGKDAYIQVEDEEIDALKLETTHTIDIETFVPRKEVDERYLDSPYYLAPDDTVAQEAFAVIRDAIREKGMAAIGRVVMARRERLILLEPLDKGLVGTTLHYAYEIRGETEIFEDIPKVDYPDEVKDLALHIVETKTGHFEPQTFEDRYETALVALIRAKQSGAQEPATPQAKPPSNVVNLMDALKRSLAAEEGGKPARKGPATKTSAGNTTAADDAVAPERKASKPAPKRAAAKSAATSATKSSGKSTAAKSTVKKPAAKQKKAS